MNSDGDNPDRELLRERIRTLDLDRELQTATNILLLIGMDGILAKEIVGSEARAVSIIQHIFPSLSGKDCGEHTVPKLRDKTRSYLTDKTTGPLACLILANKDFSSKLCGGIMSTMKAFLKSKDNTSRSRAHRLIASAFCAGRAKLKNGRERNKFDHWLLYNVGNEDVVRAARYFLLDAPWTCKAAQNLLLLGFVRVRELEMVRVSAMAEDAAHASKMNDAIHRDMHRIQDLEQDGPTRYNCFSVNLDIPTPYTEAKHRHLLADFSHPKFVEHLRKAFGDQKYSQVYFDHVWFQDSHAKVRWKPALFSTVLPEMSKWLDYKPGSNVPTAVIYLPCSSHAIIGIHAHREKIFELYEVAGLNRQQLLAEAPVYKVTQNLSDSGTLQLLGKGPDQSRYSGYRSQDMRQFVPTGMDEDKLIEEANKLYSNDTIMIRLRLLTKEERKQDVNSN